MHIHPLITDSATLANLCARLADAPFVCVDTEFMRESTFYPELCLIQIADTEEAAAIDPMAPGLDMKPLLDMLTDNEDVLQVFHAGGSIAGWASRSTRARASRTGRGVRWMRGRSNMRSAT